MHRERHCPAAAYARWAENCDDYPSSQPRCRRVSDNHNSARPSVHADRSGELGDGVGTRYITPEQLALTRALMPCRCTSWHRWNTLPMLAHAFPAVATAIERDTHPTPAGLITLTVNEFRRLIDALAFARLNGTARCRCVPFQRLIRGLTSSRSPTTLRSSGGVTPNRSAIRSPPISSPWETQPHHHRRRANHPPRRPGVVALG
jgi:hypothetical protein